MVKPGIADSPSSGVRIGWRLGLVRRRIAQQVSALWVGELGLKRGRDGRRRGRELPGDCALGGAVEAEIFEAASAADHVLEAFTVDDPFGWLAAETLYFCLATLDVGMEESRNTSNRAITATATMV